MEKEALPECILGIVGAAAWRSRRETCFFLSYQIITIEWLDKIQDKPQGYSLSFATIFYCCKGYVVLGEGISPISGMRQLFSPFQTYLKEGKSAKGKTWLQLKVRAFGHSGMPTRGSLFFDFCGLEEGYRKGNNRHCLDRPKESSGEESNKGSSSWTEWYSETRPSIKTSGISKKEEL